MAYMAINKRQVMFEKEGYAPILPGVVAPDRREKLQIICIRSIP